MKHNATSLADIFAAATEASMTIRHYLQCDTSPRTEIEDVQHALSFLIGVIEEGPTDRESQMWAELRQVNSSELAKLLDDHMTRNSSFNVTEREKK